MTRTTTLLAALLALGGCGGRNAPPELSGTLGDVVIEASFVGEPAPAAPGTILLDSVSFGRLGVITGESITGGTRPVELTAPDDLLECPPRRPCYLKGDRVYMSVWDAVAADDTVSLVLSRTWNVERLYRMTTSVVHRLKLQRAGSGWRLVRRERLPA